MHPATRYLLAPLYAYCAWSLGEALAGGPRPALWACGLAACCAAVLMPSPLVEFRCVFTLAPGAAQPSALTCALHW